MGGELDGMLIREEILTALIEHARREAPLECCGLLTGRRDLIDGVIPCTNELESPKAFSIPPRELFAAFRGMRDSGRELLGIYHSHPDGSAKPSARDFAEFHYGGASCWIVALQDDDPVVRCFSWTETGFIELDVEVVGRAAGRTRP